MRLVLLSGMGGDRRLTGPIQVPGVEVVTPDHLQPEESEDMVRYAARVAEAHGVSPSDVIGGTSFGGMLAAEIARQRPVAGLILLGTCVRPARFPGGYRLLEKFGALIPDALLGLRSRPFLVRRRFAPVTEEAVAILVAMAQASPASQVRGFARLMMGWGGIDAFNCPVLSIHGDGDRILPPACAEQGLVLKNAGHSFTLTHAAETIAAIREFLLKSNP